MDLATILADDWEIIDDVRTVQYLRRTSPSTFAAAVDVEKAFRRAIDKGDAALSPQLLASSGLIWHLWRAKLGGITPKTTDVVLEGSARWTVVRVEVMDEGERFRLTCVRER
jgi:hypothetical protein